MKTNLSTTTNGNGYWSNQSKNILITKVEMAYLSEDQDFAEIRAYFNKDDWDTNEDGLIYTDNLWIKTFKNALKNIGFSSKALKEIDYSEQGMQGDNFVSLDAKKNFIKEYNARY